MTPDEIEKYLTKMVDELRDDVLTQAVEKSTKKAQSNFDKFEEEASTDYPQVSVNHTPFSTQGNRIESTINCFGNQVIFIEFGVGIENRYRADYSYSYERNGKQISITIESPPASGFNWRGDEIAERPAGVVGLGRYGKGHGMDSDWVRPSATGIPKTNIGETHVHKRNGEVRTDAVWTKGHPPARALYNATHGVLNSIRLWFKKK